MFQELHPGLTRSPWDGVLLAVSSILLVCPRLEEPSAWLLPSSHVPSGCWSLSLSRAWGGHTGEGTSCKCCKELHQRANPMLLSPRAWHHGAQLVYGRDTGRIFSGVWITALGCLSCSEEEKHMMGSARGSSDGHRATSTRRAARPLLPTHRSGAGDTGTPALTTPTTCTHTPSHPELTLAWEN